METNREQEWYESIANNADREKFYEIFFKACRTYGIHWATATEPEKKFIEAFTRFTFSKWKARQNGNPDDVEPLFAVS